MNFTDLKSWHAPNVIKIPHSQKILINKVSDLGEVNELYYFFNFTVTLAN